MNLFTILLGLYFTASIWCVLTIREQVAISVHFYRETETPKKFIIQYMVSSYVTAFLIGPIVFSLSYTTAFIRSFRE